MNKYCSQELFNPFVSIIIPVYNDSQRLTKCLDQLEKQTYPKEKYEVIVVDNNSDENIDLVLKKYSQTKIEYEHKPGSYVARNKGISVAKGEIIGFTDADCIPNLDWIEKGVKNFNLYFNCGIIGGKIKIFFQDPDKPNAVELYESIYALQQKSYVEKYGFAATANLFTSKEVLEKVGFFEEHLKSGGDKDWCHKVTKNGYKIFYANDTCILHPARNNWKQLYRRTIRITDGIEDRRSRKNNEGFNYSLFFKELLMDFFPLKNTIRIFKESRLDNLIDKIKVIGVLFFVRYTRNWERLRLRLGKSAREKW